MITPLIALREDQVFSCWKYHLRSVDIMEALFEESLRVIKVVCEGQYDLVFLSPEKLCDSQGTLPKLINSGRAFIEKLVFFICDECHLVVDWYVRILPFQVKRAIGHPFGLLCSARFTRNGRLVTCWLLCNHSFNAKRAIGHLLVAFHPFGCIPPACFA